MVSFFRRLRRDDNGAVTVEWVVLTSAVMLLGLAAIVEVSSGLGNLAGRLDSELSEMTIASE